MTPDIEALMRTAETGDDWAEICRLESAELARAAIVIDYVCPPIPDRQFDWVAYREGDEESGHRGWGSTEQSAIDDLLEVEE